MGAFWWGVPTVYQLLSKGEIMKKIQALLLATLMMVATFARAALPTDAAAAFSALQGNGTDILAAVWPIVILLTSGWFLIKLFKKGASKAG